VYAAYGQVIHVGIAEAADPHVMHRVGELVSWLRAAYAFLDCAGRLLEAAELDPSLENVESGRLGTRKPSQPARSRLRSSASCSVSVAPAPPATRSTSIVTWGGARTNTLHDPTRWKYHALGEHPFTGVLPARHSLA
jgi:hypothetical protein